MEAGRVFNKMKKVLIIGAGQLGSRHLQGVVSVKEPLHIQVVDPNKESLEIAAKRAEEVDVSLRNNKKIDYLTDLKEVGDSITIAIIATTSVVRRKIIEQLLASKNVEFLILEKVLFTRLEDYEPVERLLKEKKVKAFVNCPRRIIPYHKKLKEIFSKEKSIHFYFTGSSWGLGCNGIHFLDMFAYLTGTTAIQLDTTLLDKEIIPSKRSSYIEFTGSVEGVTERQDKFSITSFNNGSFPLEMEIISPNHKYIIRQGTESVVMMASKDNGWVWEKESYNFPFQSQLTKDVIEVILETGTCGLTSYSESSRLHQVFLSALISFMENLKKEIVVECPIT